MFVSLFFGLLFGILLFSALIHLQIAARTGWPRRETWLLVSIAAILVFSAATLAEYRGSDLAGYFLLIRVQTACEPVFFISLLEFCLAVAGERRSRTLLGFELAFVAFFLLRQFLPFVGLYSSVSGIQAFELPWGESINLVSGAPSLLVAAYLALIAGAAAASSTIFVRMYRSGSRREAVFFAVAVGLLCFGVFFDLAVASGLFRWLYLTEASYVAVVVVASLEVTDEVIKFSELRKTLEKLLAEKNTLIKELHHRVRNNLQVVASLMSLQANQPGPESENSAIADCTGRVRSISLAHERLYQTECLADLDFGEYSYRLVEGIRLSRGLGPELILFEQRGRDLKLGLDLAVPLGLILHELAIASIKRACREGLAASISLRAVRAGDQVEFDYSDGGPGLQGGSPGGPELGQALIDGLAAQLGASGGFQAGEAGLSYSIRVPLGSRS